MQWLVVGLGAMGYAAVERLSACGHDVVGVDPLAEARERAARVANVQVVEHVRETGSWDAALVMVRTPVQVEHTLEDLDTVAVRCELLPAVFVCSTIDPDTARRLGRWGEGRFRVVEAPVTGLVAGVLEGRLTVMVAGQVMASDLQLLKATFAARIVSFEEFGQATLAKLLNNCLLAYNATALAGMLDLAANEGLPPQLLMDVLAAGSGGSFAANSLATLVPDLIDKDVRLLSGSVGPLPAIHVGTGPVTPAINRAQVLAGVRALEKE